MGCGDGGMLALVMSVGVRFNRIERERWVVLEGDSS